ncbi:putative protocatechuate -dioxygenase beta subunit protein [Neofusicoccum parvum UCRNP2]|uniref:Putative protocatechuate-dioxygenase beta subunit protein n=1 Tax=Botryosphaeria parva (strain UCR-NP2) TaxID=1287680 RepID=R1FZ90_BOTPV|nr:putative protocatechuate -dioxygenase beta subunit protein [Neofusicoccum parvum UCRNP2]
MKLTITLATAFLLATGSVAHPELVSREELQRRADLSRRCVSKVAQFNENRYAMRRKAKRDLELERSGNATFQVTTEAPYYDVIQNETCVLVPETTRGPYWRPNSQLLRQDITEGQPGVPLWLDIGVIDMETCEPLNNALVSLWHCNATGSYSSFTDLDPNTPFHDLLNQMNVTNFTIGETDLHTDTTTFLRGIWPTDANGMLEMKTVFPGFYAERTIHIHTQVMTDWVLRNNGTVSSGKVVSTGQVYFDEEISARLMALEPYASHTEIERVTNDVDWIIDEDPALGSNSIMSVVPADGENPENGVIAYITLGVDTSAVTEL